MPSSATMKNPTVHGVVCDNIKIVKSQVNNRLHATFGFSDRCGLHGRLLETVKRYHNITICIIDPLCDEIRCSTLGLSPDMEVRGPGQDNPRGRVVRQTLGELCESHPIFVAIVDVVFKGLSISPNESLGEDVYTVSYRSCTATITSELRSWNYNPFDRYGANGVSQMDIDRLTKFEFVRDTL